MLISTLSLTGLLLWWSLGSTEPFLDDNGHRLPGSISQKLSLPINGVQQGMVIRGKDASNPVLLWVHGGPGMPDYPLTQQYPTDVEDLFTVVWWDQRGAALSYDSNIPPDTMTIEHFIDDTLAVTDYLRERFDQDQIYILGHSWGSFIALQAAAQSAERYKAYLGMAQVVHQLESEKIAYDYMLAASDPDTSSSSTAGSPCPRPSSKSRSAPHPTGSGWSSSPTPRTTNPARWASPPGLLTQLRDRVRERGLGPGDLLFATRDGTPISRNTFRTASGPRP